MKNRKIELENELLVTTNNQWDNHNGYTYLTIILTISIDIYIII